MKPVKDADCYGCYMGWCKGHCRKCGCFLDEDETLNRPLESCTQDRYKCQCHKVYEEEYGTAFRRLIYNEGDSRKDIYDSGDSALD